MAAATPHKEIRILPEILSNQIAAGEVVQRPVSVVKELVENSIDAGAKRIMVEIEKGGKSLIRISDDGGGLSRDQALLAIERYATSKIFSKDDLFNISTFGFRGEALPSIASVCKFTLVSRTNESNVGVKLIIHGGKLISVEDAGAPVGTMVEVKSLFYNTPARRKFLKADSTEAGHIADAVSGMALGNPKVGFRLRFNGKNTRHFPPGQDLFHRSMSVLNQASPHHLYSLDHQEGPVTISGVCANPALTRSTANRIYLFVNHRLVHDRGVVAAMFKGYQGRIMKGRYPLGVINVHLPYDLVDVNVHPTKREVKFINARPVYLAVTRAIEKALASAQSDPLSYSGGGPVPLVGQAGSAYAAAKASPELVREKGAGILDGFLSKPRKKKSNPSPHPEIQWGEGAERQTGERHLGDFPLEPELRQEQMEHRRADQGRFDPSLASRENRDWERIHFAPEDPGPDFPEGETMEGDVVAQPREPMPPVDPPASQPSRPPRSTASFREAPRVLGQVMGTYIVGELDNRLLLIDQHAAHERIVYESLKKRHRGLAVQSQTLLVPETLELNHREADLLSSIKEELEPLGLFIEPFGGTTYVIKSVPAILAEKPAQEMVMNIIETLLETSDTGVKEAWLENCLISMACHTAIRANKPMHALEMEKLIQELFQCENPFHCPHGRPTIISFDSSDMEKLFKRVV